METSVNNKCKAFTSLEQSKKLAEILPLESADMYYDDIVDRVTGELFIPNNGSTIKVGKGLDGSIAAWSLAALLSVLPNGTNISTPDPLNKVRYSCWNDYDITYADNPVDACVAMIEILHGLEML